MTYRILLLCSILTEAFISYSQFGQEQDVVYRGTDSTIAVSAADFDGDGDMDPVSASLVNHQIAWYENLGNDVFGLSRIVTTQANDVSAIFCSDLDNDGDQDIVYSLKNANMIAWHENSSSGDFGIQLVICDTVDGATDVFCADLDNDGFVDILSGSKNDHKIAWYKNLGGGNFGPQQVINANANQVIALQAKDFDQDGIIDVVAIAGDDNSVGWYKNLGGGIFSAKITISTLVDGLVDIYAEDMNNDNKIDIISASKNDHKIAWYKNLGNGNFSAQIVITLDVFYPTAITVALVDQNVYKDVVISGATFTNSANGLYYCFNLYSSFSNPMVLIPSGTVQIINLFSCDLDEDNDADILFASNNYEIDLIGWLKNIDGINFPKFRSISDLLLRPTEVCVADLNGDGKKDIISASEIGGPIAWYPNLGANQFGIQSVIANDLYWWSNIVHAADLDGDGDQDIATGTNNSVLWYENNGSGIFDSTHVITGDPLLVPTPSKLTDIKTFDIDADGDLDIFSASEDDDRICFFENLGNGTFGQMYTLTQTANLVKSLEILDVDNDGLMDIVVGMYYEVSWYKNLGGLSFGPKLIIGTQPGTFNDIEKADIDSDGDFDVLAGGYEKAVWFENNGSTSYWTEHVINSNHHSYYTICSEDFDLDGDLDIFTTGTTTMQTPGPGVHYAFWHENIGSGLFGLEQILDSNSYGVHLGDLDEDADQEVLLFGNHRISVKENYVNHTETASGRLFADMNQNGIYDNGEYSLGHSGILSNPDDAFSYTNTNGTYSISFVESNIIYEVFPQTIPHWSLTSDSLMYHVITDTVPSSTYNLDFGYFPDDFSHELESEFIGGYPRCNSIINYWLTFRNIGTTPSSGTLHLHLDDSISFISADVVPSIINGQDIYWSYSNLNYFQEQQISVQVQLPDFNSLGDELLSTFTVTADSNGTQLFIYSDTLLQTLTCAYDPNDKTSIPNGTGEEGFIPLDTEWIEYQVRFQNTGNDTAVNVIIRDIIDTDLDRQSFILLSSSAPVTISGDQYGEMKFEFKNIMLPDSLTNELGSHGFIQYKIRLKNNLPTGTQIENTANIYFDQNPAIITNTTLQTLTDYAQIESSEINDLTIYPNPFCTGVTISSPLLMTNRYSVFMFSLAGTEVYSKYDLYGESHSIIIPGLKKGAYLLRVINLETGDSITKKVIAQ